ncbi:MAG TPA: CsbD family protein [Usitatibacter sp.]|nr:CsbD family protein [Usitatibacter sp.]
MNRDQVKGRMKEAGGKIEQKAGKAMGSTKHQVKGLAKQAAGKVQKAAGDARDDSEKGRAP